MDKNYYDVLGLSKNATDKEIKSQFYKLSKQYHPDVNPNGEEKFKEINEAYSVLGDKVKRKEYDSPKINIDDMFFNNPFFSGDMFNPHRNDSKASFVQLDVTVTESYTGFTKKIEFNKMINCDYCNGSGGETTTCSACAGQGTQRMNMGNSFFSQTFVTHCNSCNGKGKIITNPCVKCGGKGEVAEKMSFNFVAHRFIKPGNYLIKDGNVESVIVNLRVFNDQFSRENDNLIYNLVLKNDEIFANEIYIPHPDGRLILYLPKTYETRKPIRLKGKGFDGGDYYIKIDVAVEK